MTTATVNNKPGFLGYLVALGFILWLATFLAGGQMWAVLVFWYALGFVGGKTLFDAARNRNRTMFARVLAGVFTVPFAALIVFATYVGVTRGFI